MNSVAAEWLKLIGALLGLAAAVFMAWCKVIDSREKKREKAIQAEFNLADNPTRCGEHKAKIEGLEKAIETNGREHGQMFTQLGGISLELVGIKKDIESIRRES